MDSFDNVRAEEKIRSQLSTLSVQELIILSKQTADAIFKVQLQYSIAGLKICRLHGCPELKEADALARLFAIYSQTICSAVLIEPEAKKVTIAANSQSKEDLLLSSKWKNFLNISYDNMIKQYVYDLIFNKECFSYMDRAKLEKLMNFTVNFPDHQFLSQEFSDLNNSYPKLFIDNLTILSSTLEKLTKADETTKEQDYIQYYMQSIKQALKCSVILKSWKLKMANNREVVNLQLQLVELGLDFMQVLDYMRRRKKLFRRWWSKPHIRQNYLTGYGGYQSVFKYFQLYDEEEFVSFTRTNVQTFEYLYQLVQARLIKRSRRPPLPPELRLALTLNYLAHADSIKKAKWFFKIGKSTVKKVIPEVCSVLCEILAPIFLRFPSRNQFQVIANDFMTDLFYPNCIGALDGRHCEIKKPPNSGSLFYNYKKFFSVVLMACCDSKKRFIWANVGDYGSLNDANIFANSDFGRALLRNEVELPQPAYLPNTQILFPFHMIGDGIFPLKRYLMKPFIRNDNLAMFQRAYNYRLSFARRIIESAFGELALVWLVHQSSLDWKLPTTDRIIMSTICLHNLLLDFKYDEVGNRWNNLENNDIGLDELDNGDIINNFRFRDQLCQYFVSPQGSVPWQWAKM